MAGLPLIFYILSLDDAVSYSSSNGSPPEPPTRKIPTVQLETSSLADCCTRSSTMLFLWNTSAFCGVQLMEGWTCEISPQDIPYNFRKKEHLFSPGFPLYNLLMPLPDSFYTSIRRRWSCTRRPSTCVTPSMQLEAPGPGVSGVASDPPSHGASPDSDPTTRTSGGKPWASKGMKAWSMA